MKLTPWSVPLNPVFKVGDRVLVPWTGDLKIPAVVIEDRGPLAEGDKRLGARPFSHGHHCSL